MLTSGTVPYRWDGKYDGTDATGSVGDELWMITCDLYASSYIWSTPLRMLVRRTNSKNARESDLICNSQQRIVERHLTDSRRKTNGVGKEISALTVLQVLQVLRDDLNLHTYTTLKSLTDEAGVSPDLRQVPTIE